MTPRLARRDWRSGGPRFKSHPRLTFQSWSSYQLNLLFFGAAWYVEYNLSKKLCKLFIPPIYLIVSETANSSLWFAQCQINIFGYCLFKIAATPVLCPNIAEAPSAAKQIKWFCKYIPLIPFQSKHEMRDCAKLEESVFSSSTMSKKNVTGSADPETTALMQTVSTVLPLTDVASSIKTEILLLLRIISSTSLRRISHPMWAIMSAQEWSECKTLPISRPFICCNSMSPGKSVNGRSRLAILYIVRKTRIVVKCCSS